MFVVRLSILESSLPLCRLLSVARSSRHTTHNPQSTNVAVKCTVCQQIFYSYYFTKHWDKMHRGSHGDLPSAMERKVFVSQAEQAYFRRERGRRREQKLSICYHAHTQKQG